jgi:4-diphosphocytidyl-2-C-methyl-D-erythritol kinase
MTSLIAPAKLTLYLAVGAVRPDSHHGLTAVFCALEDGDAVTVEPASRLSLACEPPVGVPDHENLAWRAAAAMGEAFGRAPDFTIRIEKRIPAGGGLGGGSGDAAAVIAAIAAAWEIDRDDPRLEAVARALGADVAFPLRGGCAAYGGRGDVLKRTLPVPRVHLAIVSAGVPVSTAAAYAAFDEEPRPPAPGPRAVTDAIVFQDAAALGAAVFNNMTAVACRLVPSVADALVFVERSDGCLGATVAGSGSSVFGIFAEESTAQAVGAAAAARGWWSLATRPREGGTLDQTMGVRAPGPIRHPRTR